MPLKESDIEQGLALIYAAGLDPTRWTDVITHIGDMLDGAYMCIHGQDVRSNSLLGIMGARYDPEFLKTYEEHYAPLNVWNEGAAVAPLGVPTLAEKLAPRETLLKSEFYADWVQPQEDIATGCGVVLFRDDERFLALGGNLRLKDQETRQDDMRRALGLFAPHLRQAFDLQRRIVRSEAEGAINAIDAADPTAAVFVLDSAARPIAHNKTGEAWLKAGCLWRNSSGALTMADQNGAAVLEALATHGSVDRARQRIIAVKGRPGPVLHLLYPLPTTLEASPLDWGLPGGRPAALLHLVDARIGGSTRLASAAVHFGLTDAERRLAEALCHGRTLAQYAQERGVSVNTARSQLASIFLKTECSRQTELVAKLRAFEDRTPL